MSKLRQAIDELQFELGRAVRLEAERPHLVSLAVARHAGVRETPPGRGTGLARALDVAALVLVIYRVQ